MFCKTNNQRTSDNNHRTVSKRAENFLIKRNECKFIRALLANNITAQIYLGPEPIRLNGYRDL